MDKIQIIDKYEPLFLEVPKTRYYLITGGRGSGKSWTLSMFLLNLTYQEGHVILFTRWTLTSAFISIIPEFIDKIELMNKSDDFEITQSEIINKATGSKILFRGIKTSQGTATANLKSIANVTTWVMDEAEELVDEDIFDRIDLSVRAVEKANRVLLIMNPATKEHWVYKRFFEDYMVNSGFTGTKNDCTYIHTTYLDNIENLNTTVVARFEAMKQRNPTKFNHIVMGNWMDKAEGAIFENWKIADFDTSLPFGFGMDFGFSVDPTTLIKVAVDEDKGLIYCKECFAETGLTTTDIAKKIGKYCQPNDMIVADSAEPRLINEIYNFGFNIIPCTKGPDSIRYGIKKMQDYQIVVSQESKTIIKELNNYVWNDKRSDTPVDDFNHTIDAIRYAFDKLSVSKFWHV
jgi:phage terminase large subunit